MTVGTPKKIVLSPQIRAVNVIKSVPLTVEVGYRLLRCKYCLEKETY